MLRTTCFKELLWIFSNFSHFSFKPKLQCTAEPRAVWARCYYNTNPSVHIKTCFTSEWVEYELSRNNHIFFNSTIYDNFPLENINVYVIMSFYENVCMVWLFLQINKNEKQFLPMPIFNYRCLCILYFFVQRKWKTDNVTWN